MSASRRRLAGAALAACLLGVLTLLAPPAAFAAGPAFVQVAAATPAGTQSTVAVTFAASQAAGDSNVVAIGWNDTVSTITSVTDSHANSYTVAVPTFRGNGLSQAVYYASRVAAGTDTVTVRFNQAASYVDVRAAEYAGLGALDVSHSASGASGNASSGNATTTNASDLLVGAGMSGGAYSGAGTGYTKRIITAADSDLLEDRTVAATGAYAATAPNTGPWLMTLAAFKAATGGQSAPVADFSASPLSGTAPLAVAFTDASTNAPTSWAWTFGDGGTSTAQNPGHTYTTAGTYSVSLTATNAAGSGATTKSGYIVVNAAPTGWPDGSNTGPPAGTTLSTYTGPCTITAANTVINAKTVNCDLDIATTGVLIENSVVNGEINGGEGTGSSFTVRWSRVVNGARSACMCVGSDNFTMSHVEVVGGNRGVYCRRTCNVQDSWIHGQQLLTTQHASALREEQGSYVHHNTLSCDWPNPDDATSTGCSADLTGYPDFAPINHNTVDDNLFVAQQTPGAAQVVGFCAYGGATGGKPFSGDATNATYQVFTNNVFQRGTSGRCGDFGPVTDFDTTRTGNLWSGNRWDDGQPVPPG